MSVRECRARAPDRDHAICLPLPVVVEDFCRPIPTRSSRKNSHSAGEACVACSTISIKAAASGRGADGYGAAAATGPIRGCLQRGGGYRPVTPRTELWALVFTGYPASPSAAVCSLAPSASCHSTPATLSVF